MTQETAATEVVVEKPVESDSAFSDGFDQARGKPPAVKPEAKAEPKVEAPKSETKEPEKKPEPEVDPVKAQLDSITKTLGDLAGSFGKIDQRFKSFEGRIHKVDEKVAAIVDAGKAAVAAAPAADKAAVASKVDDQLKQVGVDLPDVAELVKAARDELRADMKPVDVAAIEAKFEKAVTERVAEVQAQTKVEVAAARVLAAIDLKHDGWEETINTPEFETWYVKQAPEVQALSASPKAAAAIQMLDLFKADQAKAKQAKEEKEANDAKLARAIAPKGVVGTPAPTQTEDEALEAGFSSVRGR
jgi:hypothetical protein